MRLPDGFHIDNIAFPLVQAYISYWGVSSAIGSALGITLVDANLATEPSYDGNVLKILSGPSAGQARTIATHVGGTLTVGVAFTNPAGAVQQQAAGTLYVILSALGAGGGPGPAPSEGLSYYGIVDAVPGANQFTISGLVGLGAGKFAGATNPYTAFVLRDVGGLSAAPQGEALAITAYATATGVFTTGAFTAAVAVGDEILLLHPSIANVLVILAGLAVPPIDSAINLLMRDVTGNKADTALYAATLTDSLMRYLKAVLHTEVLAIGTFTASSATVPADAARTEANDAWKGCLLMPLVAGAGPTAFQPKRIESFANAGGVFTMDPSNPFTSATGLVAYAILPAQADYVPAADGALNISTSEVVGNKASTAIYAKDGVSDIVRYLKGLVDATITAWGTADAGSGVGLIRDAARTEANDWWNGQTVLMLTGAAAGQKRPVSDFLAATDDIVVSPNFDAAVGAGDVYVILAHYNQIVPRTADAVANALSSDVVGRKDDTADYTTGATQSSIVRFLKGLLGSTIIAEGTFTTNSAFAPADTALTQGANYFDGQILIPLTGVCAFQPRHISFFSGAAAGGVFDMEENFEANPGLVAYIVVASGFSMQKLRDIEQIVERLMVLVQAYITTTTIRDASVTLFALDATGGPKKDVQVSFFLVLDAAATFTPAWYVTRIGDPAVFTVRRIPAIATIATPGVNGRYQYDFGDLPEGMQLEFRVAQNNLGNATNVIDGALTYLTRN